MVSQIPCTISQIKSSFNYRQIWHFVDDKGKELYGPKFALFEADMDVLLKLFAWFAGDENVANNMGIDLHKGILLTGPVGCGKTSLMNACRFLLPAEKRHRIKSCRDVSFEFAKDGYEIFHKYTRASFSDFKGEPKTYCFDDLGLESEINFFGNQCLVMSEVLLSRYDLFQSFNMITHITSNLNSQEIEQKYGVRVRSRMREMFNLVSFKTESADKRV